MHRPCPDAPGEETGQEAEPVTPGDRVTKLGQEPRCPDFLLSAFFPRMLFTEQFTFSRTLSSV